MSLLRRLSPLGLALLLLGGLSCTTGDTLTEVPVAADQQPAPSFSVSDGLSSTLDGGTSTVTGTIVSLTDLDLLACSPQTYQKVTQTIGSDGGVIAVGSHRLVIPPGALSGRVKITAEQMSGSTNSVRFSPEGLRFEHPATLTLSYQNCSANLLKKKVVYTDEQLSIRELLFSVDNSKSDYVSAPIEHFSRYAVAY